MEPISPKPPTNDQVVTPVVEKPKKEKKPATEAQQAARQKGLQAMMEKRKQMSNEVKEKREKIKVAKKVVEDKILKEDLKFASLNDIDSLRKELYELRGMVAMKQQVEKEIKEKPIPAPAKPAERIVERVIERVPTPSAPTKLTGYALLDKVFFDK